MNVLSLFDGISCGKLALHRAGLPVTHYYASEIDKTANWVSNQNHGSIIRLGDVRKVNPDKLPKIDLLLAGSPCQGFSALGDQQGFRDHRSGLYGEFLRILHQCKPKYYLLENVVMKPEYWLKINDYMGHFALDLDSALVSAARRRRLYWTNIPNVKQPMDRGITYDDIYDPNAPRATVYDIESMAKWKVQKNPLSYAVRLGKKDKLKCLSTKSMGFDQDLFSKRGNYYHNITMLELERAMTLPDNYTKDLSFSAAKKCIGNGWTVDMITHILRHI